MSRRHVLAVLICVGLVSLLLSAKELRSSFAASSVNDPPVAVDDSYTVHGHKLMHLMDNDYNPEGDGLTFNALESQPQHGTLSLYTTGSYTYHPTYGYVGPDSFTYSIKDSANNIVITHC